MEPQQQMEPQQLANQKIPNQKLQKTIPTTTKRSAFDTLFTKDTKRDELFGLTSSHGQDVKDARYKSVTNPKVINPLTFTDATDRHAAILARADRIVHNEKYQKLPNKQKQIVLSRYYDKYVKPGYEVGGFTAPEKSSWIQELPKLANAGKLTEEYYFPSTNHKQAIDTEAGIIQSLDQIHYGGVKLSRMAANTMLGLGHFFHLTNDEDYVNLKENIEKVAQNRIDKISQDSTNEATFWLQAHPSKSWTGQIDSFIGENLVQLPFYEAIGAMRTGVIGATALKLPEAGKVANLTKWLGTSKLGQFVGRRLADSGDAFLGSALMGGTTPETLHSMAIFMTLGSTVEGVGALPKLSKFLMKSVLSRFGSMGGRPLVESVENQASHELQNLIIAKTSDGGEIKLVPSSKETGHVEANGIKVPYTNLQEQQQLVSRVLQNHKEIDPIHYSMVNSGKMVMAHLANDRYGKPFAELNKGQQLNIKKAFRKLTGEAMDELPLHNSDLSKMHIDSQLKEDVQQNPKLGQRIAEAEKASGIKVSSALQDTEAEAIKKQTGIHNNQDATKKISTVKDPVKLSKASIKAREEEPRKYVQFKIDSLAYLKNYAKKFDPKSTAGLTAEIREMDEPHEFAHALQEQMGQGDIHFETDKHALLWANQFRFDLPKQFQKRLQEELHELNPMETQKIWDEQSENLSTHMEDLAQTGRLFSQGNVFRSTQVEQWMDKTKWQHELQKEVEAVELARLNKVLYRYPELKKMATSLTKKLQKARALSEQAKTYKYISDEIRGQKTVEEWKRVLRVK